jgi:hypothetical protein
MFRFPTSPLRNRIAGGLSWRLMSFGIKLPVAEFARIQMEAAPVPRLNSCEFSYILANSAT